LNNIWSLSSKIVKWQMCTLYHGGVFGGTKSGVGYLRVWEGHCQWFVLGEFYIVMIKKNNQMQHRSFWGFFGKCFPYFQGKLLKVAMGRYYIHKKLSIQNKILKKNLQPI
jgi:hypothetical protein